MDVQKLLERINYHRPIDSLNVEVLDSLCSAFIFNVPFDTLDLFGGQTKVLNLKEIYTNIVIKRRGGFCHELNSIFHWMLSCIGFEVDMVKTSPYSREQYEFKGAGNMALLVTMKNGEKRLLDVGAGDKSFYSSLSMDMLGRQQVQPNGIYRVRRLNGVYFAEKKTCGSLSNEVASRMDDTIGDSIADWVPIFRFTTEGYKIQTFREEFSFAVCRERLVSGNPNVILPRENGARFLLGKTFVETEYLDPRTIRTVSTRECKKDEFYVVLKQYFGISVDFHVEVEFS